MVLRFAQFCLFHSAPHQSTEAATEMRTMTSMSLPSNDAQALLSWEEIPRRRQREIDVAPTNVTDLALALHSRSMRGTLDSSKDPGEGSSSGARSCSFLT